uniref:transcription elongation regulator 1-like protein n=1 Tax=Lonchura striata TaxID=40157 RepID=UPI00129344C3|nr:transcription elongation regulator 1-like protein [Lonchura striata domestica]
MLPAAAPRPPPLLWAPPAEPPAPPWAWVLPAAAGLLRVGAAAAGAPPPPPPPPPLLLPPPALLRPGPGWRGPAEPPLLPLLPAAAEPLLHGQWIFGAHSPLVGFSPSSSVEFVPVLPPAYSAAVPKGWMDKRLPSCKIYLNSAFALDPAWIQPEEPRLLQGAEKPLLLSSRVALAVARPAAASRPLPTLLLAPQLLPGGCQNSLKAVGGSPGLALLALEPAAAQGPGPGPQPCPLLGCCPAKAPLLPSPCPGSASRLDTAAGPLLPAQVTRVTAVTAPAVTLLATNLLEPVRAERGKESSRAACPPTLILHTTDRKSVPRGRDSGQDHSFKLLRQADSASSGNKPVASAPVPGSPWCVVWTGDDRVFFFNASTQLSVWERPLALRHRGDIARLLEDPPHKRKLEAAATDKCVSSCPGDENDELSIKTKRNKTEQCQAAGTAGAEEEQAGEEGSAPRLSPPLEERITHFRDMLLERGVRTSPAGAQQLLELCPGSGSAASSAGALSLSPAGTAAAVSPRHPWEWGPFQTNPGTSRGSPSTGRAQGHLGLRALTCPGQPWGVHHHKLQHWGASVTHCPSKIVQSPVLWVGRIPNPTQCHPCHGPTSPGSSLVWVGRIIFEQFVKTRVREEYKEKKNKLLLAKEEFKKLLEESKLSPRTTFKEFAEKHGRDQRFRLVQKKKDQEHFFNQFILILKKRDKENRIRLRKMR